MSRASTWGVAVALAVGSVAVLAGNVSAAPASLDGRDPIDNTSRASIITTYQRDLEPLLGVPVGWTGSIEGCKAGHTSAADQAATLAAVNYVRALADLPGVKLDPDLSRKSQQAALIMAANGYLSHTPPRTAKCWTKAGYTGASSGNLYLGWGSDETVEGEPPSDATGARAVVGYLVDDGSNNTLAGHRRWLLYEQLTVIGSGDTTFSNSIYVLPPKYLPPKGTKWVAWPMPGYFPRELEPKGRWSLSYPGADFRRAKVTVTGPSGPIKSRKETVANGYGDNTMVWQLRMPAAYAAEPAADFPVKVKVTGIRLPGGRAVSRSWSTTFVRATAVPLPSPTPSDAATAPVG